MMLWRALLLSAAVPAAALSVSLQQERQIDPTNLASTATVPQIGEIEPWQIREFMAAQVCNEEATPKKKSKKKAGKARAAARTPLPEATSPTESELAMIAAVALCIDCPLRQAMQTSMSKDEALQLLPKINAHIMFITVCQIFGRQFADHADVKIKAVKHEI